MNQGEDLRSAIKRGDFRHQVCYTVIPNHLKEDFDYLLRLSPSPATTYVNISWTHRGEMCLLVVRGAEPLDLFLDLGDSVDLEIVQQLAPAILHATRASLEEEGNRLTLAGHGTGVGVGASWDAAGDEFADFFLLSLVEGLMEGIDRTI